MSPGCHFDIILEPWSSQYAAKGGPDADFRHHWATYFWRYFFNEFWLPPGSARGDQPQGGRGYLPGCVFINILAHNSDITMCFWCFPDYWIPVPVEREISSGNLPLSEGVSEEYSGETTGIWAPHASRAGGTVADIRGNRENQLKPTLRHQSPIRNLG